LKRLVFIDTSYLVALMNQPDGFHERAIEMARGFGEARMGLLTTDAVLVEYANYFCAQSRRAATIQSITSFRSSPVWIIMPITSDLQVRAERRYARHGDKHWSLTDCLSMEVMLEHKTKDVATADHHFAQAGFRVLMR
jgi:predicted nucleic acid-binding protein